MFGWLFGNKYKKLDEKTQNGFSRVGKDIKFIGKWIKHLDKRDRELFDLISSLKKELSSVYDEIESVREGVDLISEQAKNKQVFKKMPVFDKQTAVEGVQNAVQTAVQTDNFYEILRRLSGNERLVIFTLMNSDMKLSYEDIALLLGKERSTIRGQMNSIKQKTGGLFIKEVVEKNGKKRVFIPEDIQEKLAKYAKVRAKKGKKKS